METWRPSQSDWTSSFPYWPVERRKHHWQVRIPLTIFACSRFELCIEEWNLLDWNETNCPVDFPCLIDCRSTTRDLLANHSILKLLAKHVRTPFQVWKSVVRRLARAFKCEVGLWFGISGQSIDSKPVQSISKERFFKPKGGRIRLTSTEISFLSSSPMPGQSPNQSRQKARKTRGNFS